MKTQSAKTVPVQPSTTAHALKSYGESEKMMESGEVMGTKLCIKCGAPIPTGGNAMCGGCMKSDMVNHPPHYQSDHGIECIESIHAMLGDHGFIAYCRGNALKYNWRNKIDSLEDRDKATWYLNRANEVERAMK